MTICANCATCRWETLTMLNPQLIAGEHGLFGGHESKAIQTFLMGFLFYLGFFSNLIVFWKVKKSNNKRFFF